MTGSGAHLERVLERLTRKIATLRAIGLPRVVLISFDRFLLELLEIIFRFDPWHSQAPTSARPYRTVVAEMVNMLEPTTVVEVGCGLGENLALIRAPQRYGYDVDEGVIRAARFLRGGKIQFTVGSFSEVKTDTIDVLILINWIHELSPADLEARLAPLFSRTHYLLLDAIDEDGPTGYRFKHDFEFLAPNCKLLATKRPESEGRTFKLFEMRV